MAEKKSGKRLLNRLDWAVLVVILASGLGFLLARAGYAGVDKVIQGKDKVYVDIFISGLKTKDVNLFQVNELSAITIRNQPVEPPLIITNVEHNQKLTSFLTPDGKKVVAFPDPANPLAHDFVLTVATQDSAKAEKTKDGYVISGNKIKIGNLVELESFKYRVQGVVVDIHP